ncbi:MAG: tRNA (guanosine(46)-N7)-methyltransferase TrmB [Holosporales bacterium]|jgi:tRNA (guanine-N7-)-methyltransferase|nr:tRNA (guanosine(46)-N7)-methyltransferase TrmB [Holosporales bacterium]
MGKLETCRNFDRLYGRVKNRALTKRQSWLYEFLLPSISITSFDPSQYSAYRSISLEIGFGSGEHLCQFAIANPDKLFIGCEFFVNGIASLLSKIDEGKIQNIRIFQGDARKLLPEIPDDFFEYIFLLFPDPWPKRKHTYRRFVQEKTMFEIYRILQKGGIFRIATDCLQYSNWITNVFSAPIFDKKFEIKKFLHDFRPPESDWPKTRYEQKSTSECTFFSIEKLSSL